MKQRAMSPMLKLKRVRQVNHKRQVQSTQYHLCTVALHRSQIKICSHV